MTVAVYAGSFDPPTYGHLSVAAQAAQAFDSFIIAVGHNSAKSELFYVDERMQFLRDATQSWDNIRIVSFEGLLVEYCRSLLERCKKVVIVRGLRAVSDFEQEMGIADINRKICPEVSTLFLPTQVEHAFISSSAAKEMARYPGAHEALLKYVPEEVAEALIERTMLILRAPKEQGPSPVEREDDEEPEQSPDC